MTRQGRILVAEDDPKTAEIVRLYLVHAGFEVRMTADGAAALDAARDESPDLVILDWMLPGGSGISVCPGVCIPESVLILFFAPLQQGRKEHACRGTGSTFSPRSR